MAEPGAAPTSESLRRDAPAAHRWPALAIGAALVVALAGMLATLAVAAPIDPQTMNVRYGKPLWFAESDLSQWRSLSPREKRLPVPFNPLENPTRVDPGRFLLSYLVFAAPLCGIVWLASMRLRLGRRTG
jgi:hypothetical protein